MGKKVLLDRAGLQKALGLKGTSGKLVAGMIYRILGLERLNRKYPKVSELYGPEFSSAVLKEMGISYEILPDQVERIPLEGGFFTVSNHHFGGADGLILNDVVGRRRKDFKILTTFLLAKIPNLTESFIPVDNFSTAGSKSVTGIRHALEHIVSGGPLGLFPAGEVATWQKKRFRTAVQGKHVVEDKPWADNIIRLVRNSGLPVVPVYFDGGNSKLFHLLGRIHPLLRTLRLARELTNKQGTVIKVRIGQPIQASEIAGMHFDDVGHYLRSRCYALESECYPPVKEKSSMPVSELAPPVDPELIRSQMKDMEHKLLFHTGDYEAYLLDASDAPAVMKELFRLREETFRGVGEGTGNPEDTDSYDSYYKHLVLWNVPNGEIVGAYRVGYGSEIFATRGVEGFYTSSLINYGPDAESILPHSMELGRSFIVGKYQREVLPLKLMLSGLTAAVAKDPDARSCIGTVSISNSMPDFYKSLAVYFLERDFCLPQASRFASPTHPFKPDFLRVNPDDLLQIPKGDIDALDRLLWSMSGQKYRLPVLLRKYFSCGARVACFNVDPLFFNSLDGMIVLRVDDFPPSALRSIVRPLSKEMQDAVFQHFYGTNRPE